MGPPRNKLPVNIHTFMYVCMYVFVFVCEYGAQTADLKSIRLSCLQIRGKCGNVQLDVATCLAHMHNTHRRKLTKKFTTLGKGKYTSR